MRTSNNSNPLRRARRLAGWSAMLSLWLGGALTGYSQDGAAILKLLVEKGLITEAEAQALVQEAKQAEPAPAPAAAALASKPVDKTRVKSITPTAKGWPLEKLSFSGRLQAQFAHITTDIDGAEDPATVNHFFMRRVYFGAKAQLAENFTGAVTFDFASHNLDAAYLGWKFDSDNELRVGLTKVPIAIEEHMVSSGSLKAIERSAVTRYFVEPNNGRRLGGGVYRNGIFLNGSNGNLLYRFALTNPERVDSATSAGSSWNNGLAPWGFVGYKGELSDGDFLAGLSVGFMPDQGGQNLGTGSDLTVVGVPFSFSYGSFSLLSEFMWANNENGAVDGSDARPWGYFIQPSYKFSEAFEGVVRFSYVDSDGRGISLSDAIRSGPSGGTMNRLYEGYLGANWYIVGNNIKLQAGLVYGKSKDKVTGEPAEAESFGFRSMVQLQY